MQRKDPTLAPLITYLETKTLPEDDKILRTIIKQCDNFFLDDYGLLQHVWTPTGRNRTEAKTQLTVPTSLRYEVLKSFHDNPLGGVCMLLVLVNLEGLIAQNGKHILSIVIAVNGCILEHAPIFILKWSLTQPV